jgi:REP element-mobilizing transposase RayT
MPNHVHVLFQPIGGWTMAGIVASWKKFSATRICAFRRASGNATPGNANLPIGVVKAKEEATETADREIGVPRKPEPVWHREYWDRFIRDGRHFRETLDYIHNNPVKAGLVATAQQWVWSSAAAWEEKEEANREPGNANLPIGAGKVKNEEETERANQEIGDPGHPGHPGGMP